MRITIAVDASVAYLATSGDGTTWDERISGSPGSILAEGELEIVALGEPPSMVEWDNFSVTGAAAASAAAGALGRLINRPCTLQRADDNSAADVEGDVQTTHTDVETVCELQARSRDETGEGEISGSDWRVYFLPSEDMGDKPGLNKLVVDDLTFEFVGRPAHVWDSLRESFDHWAADVAVVE